jgi:hypothetical protein
MNSLMTGGRVDDLDLDVNNESGELDWLHGHCHTYTAALHKLTGYPAFDLVYTDGDVIHSVVQLPNGDYLDASGVTTLEKLVRYYGAEGATFQPTDVKRYYPFDEADWTDEWEEEYQALKDAQAQLALLKLPDCN